MAKPISQDPVKFAENDVKEILVHCRRSESSAWAEQQNHIRDFGRECNRIKKRHLKWERWANSLELFIIGRAGK